MARIFARAGSEILPEVQDLKIDGWAEPAAPIDYRGFIIGTFEQYHVVTSFDEFD